VIVTGRREASTERLPGCIYSVVEEFSREQVAADGLRNEKVLRRTMTTRKPDTPATLVASASVPAACSVTSSTPSLQRVRGPTLVD
jgi:hypothetical protein